MSPRIKVHDLPSEKGQSENWWYECSTSTANFSPVCIKW